MDVIDCQVHVWDENSPDFPWDSKSRALADATNPRMATFVNRTVTVQDQIQQMDAIGVDRAVLVSPYVVYGYNSEYSFHSAGLYPDRFRVILPIDPLRLDIENELLRVSLNPLAVGVRLLYLSPSVIAEDRRYRSFFDAAARLSIPVCMSTRGEIAELDRVASAYPDTTIVIDHLGMPVDGDPSWRGLDRLLALSTYSNVAVKATAVPVHSAAGFPFEDVFPALDRVVDAFGVERVMWGSDWTRVQKATYGEGVRYLRDTSRFSDGDKKYLLGLTFRQIFGWK